MHRLTATDTPMVRYTRTIFPSYAPKSESEIYEQFNELSKNKLAIFISHRMASTRFCDNIIVFKNGSSEEMGSHYELMKAHSVYWNLFNMQSKYYMSAEMGA